MNKIKLISTLTACIFIAAFNLINLDNLTSSILNKTSLSDLANVAQAQDETHNQSITYADLPNYNFDEETVYDVDGDSYSMAIRRDWISGPESTGNYSIGQTIIKDLDGDGEYEYRGTVVTSYENGTAVDYHVSHNYSTCCL